MVADQSTDDIIAGFPSDLFLTLVGITYLFVVAQNNGTVDWLVELGVRVVRGRIGAMPWIMFALAAMLTAVGAVSPGAVAIIAPIALGFAVQYQISPLLMGLMVIHGAQAGGFSPISIYGGITNGVVEEAGLPLNEIATFLASLFVNLAVAVLLFMVLGGRDLLRRRAEVTERPGGDAAEPAGAAAGTAGRHREREAASWRARPSRGHRPTATPRWRPAARNGSWSGRRRRRLGRPLTGRCP